MCFHRQRFLQFYFLQAQHVGLRALQIIEKMGQPDLDRVDVPARDLHVKDKAGSGDRERIAAAAGEAAFGFLI